MHKLGLLLIAIGFVGGSLTAVYDKDTIDWVWFVPLLIIGAVGVTLVQIALRRAATDTSHTEANFQAIASSLTAIVAKLGVLDGEKDKVYVYDLPDRIDETFRDDILKFVEARESIAVVHGTQAYADVMSHFAAGERYLNRVWSCAADGYIDEAHTYIERSHQQFKEAQEKLEAVALGSSSSGADAAASAG